MILHPIIDLLKRIVVDLPEYVKPSGGGVTITKGLVATEVDSGGAMSSADWYGDLGLEELASIRSNTTKPITVRFVELPTIIPTNALYQANIDPDVSTLVNVKSIGAYGLALNLKASNDLRQKTLNLPNYDGSGYSNIRHSRFRIANTTYFYATINFPKCQYIGEYDFYQTKVADISYTFGSIGYPVTACGNLPFGGSGGSGTITLFTTGALLDTISTAVQNGAGANYTWVYKASEETTYDGTTYQAGDTMLTV